MPIEAQTPQLDTRKFEDLKRQALLRIPRYTPEWTDWNESDPGVTLVELFAWLTEMMLYEMNRVPERNYLKFLQILGLELRPAQAAVAHLTFTPQASAPVLPVVPQYSQVGGQPPSGGKQMVFETTAGLGLIRLPLTDVQVFDGAAFSVVTPANALPGTTFRPLGWQPVIGSALYFGFSQTAPQATPEPTFPQEMRWRVFLPLNQITQPPLICDTISPQPVPPVSLVWEYRSQSNPGYWRRLQVFDDQSAAFTREGSVLVEGPSQPALTSEGRIAENRVWIRVRLADGAYPAGMAPLVDFMRPNVVDAQNLATVTNEPLEPSQGTPNQVFRLRFPNVLKDSLSLEVAEPNAAPEIWVRKDDFLSSGPDDPHYVLSGPSGEIQFGDGIYGRIPIAGAELTARSYRYGGGTAGNLDKNMINALLSQVTGIEKVTNERPAVGGRDEQSLSEFIKFAPARLRCRDRAVSAEDYTALAKEVGGIANAVALPQFHPDHKEVAVPGAITVVIVPDTADLPPRPSPDQLEAVCTYLNDRRLITAEVYVKGPEYLPVQVSAIVEANPYAAFDQVSNNIVAALNADLNPLIPDLDAGTTPDGVTQRRKIGPRDFGEDFFPTRLYSVIQNVKDVRAVRNLSVTINHAFVQNLNDRIRLAPDQMVYGVQDHAITVVPFKDL